MKDEDKEYDVTEPLEGAGTLVAQFSIFQIDIIIKELKQLRSSGTTEDELKDHLLGRAGDLDDSSRAKILMLSREEVPADDFEVKDIKRLEEIDETKYEISLKQALSGVQVGSLVYFQNKRWIVTALDGVDISIKNI